MAQSEVCKFEFECLGNLSGQLVWIQTFMQDQNVLQLDILVKTGFKVKTLILKQDKLGLLILPLENLLAFVTYILFQFMNARQGLDRFQ